MFVHHSPLDPKEKIVSARALIRPYQDTYLYDVVKKRTEKPTQYPELCIDALMSLLALQRTLLSNSIFMLWL